MTTLRKRNQHTPPSEYTTATAKTYTATRIKDMARECHLTAALTKIGGTWDWYITTTDGLPCFQGQGHEAALWLRGYQRGVEDHGEVTP